MRAATFRKLPSSIYFRAALDVNLLELMKRDAQIERVRYLHVKQSIVVGQAYFDALGGAEIAHVPIGAGHGALSLGWIDALEILAVRLQLRGRDFEDLFRFGIHNQIEAIELNEDAGLVLKVLEDAPVFRRLASAHFEDRPVIGFPNDGLVRRENDRARGGSKDQSNDEQGQIQCSGLFPG